MDDNILIRKHGERRIHRAAAGGVDDGGVDLTARGGRGGEEEAAPRGRMVDGVKREQRREKKLFPTERGKYPGGGGKKLNSKIRDNCTGHCSMYI